MPEDQQPIERDVTAYFRALVDGHQNHDRINGLAEIAHDLDGEDFWFLFRQCYLYTRALYPFHNAIRDMLTPDRLNATERLGQHSDETLSTWRERIRRRRPLKIYRGAQQQNLTGFAWTTRREYAVSYAQRSGSSQPKVVVGRVDPRRIVMAIDEDGRKEIVAFPEHVGIDAVEDLKPMPELPNAAMIRQIEAQGLPIEAVISNVRTAPARLGVSTEDAIHSFKAERDYLRSLGFNARPAFLHDLVVRLAEPQPESFAKYDDTKAA